MELGVALVVSPRRECAGLPCSAPPVPVLWAGLSRGLCHGPSLPLCLSTCWLCLPTCRSPFPPAGSARWAASFLLWASVSMSLKRKD